MTAPDRLATFVRDITGWPGEVALYRLDPPMTDHGTYYGDRLAALAYVIASAVTYHSGSETYLFPADADGNPLDDLELPGSTRGTTNHAVALSRAGYEVAS